MLDHNIDMTNLNELAADNPLWKQKFKEKFTRAFDQLSALDDRDILWKKLFLNLSSLWNGYYRTELGFESSDYIPYEKRQLMLHEVIRCGCLELVNFLIANGADVNLNDHGPKEHRTFRYESPLHLAVTAGYQELVNTLIAHGANINLKEGAFTTITPLHLAAERGHQEIANILIAHGADVNAKISSYSTKFYSGYDSYAQEETGRTEYTYFEYHNDTPLHSAAKNGHLGVINALIENGAHINALNYGKLTPLDYVKRNFRHLKTESNLAAVNVFLKVKLLNYLNEVNKRPNNHYINTLTIFGRTWNFGHSALMKKEAAELLKKVYIDHTVDESMLNDKKLKAALNNGRLGKIRRDFAVFRMTNSSDKIPSLRK